MSLSSGRWMGAKPARPAKGPQAMAIKVAGIERRLDAVDAKLEQGVTRLTASIEHTNDRVSQAIDILVAQRSRLGQLQDNINSYIDDLGTKAVPGLGRVVRFFSNFDREVLRERR